MRAATIRQLDGDPECLDALAWLAEHEEQYPVGKYIPPLTGRSVPEKPRRFLTVTFRLARVKLKQPGMKIAAYAASDQGGASFASVAGDAAALAAGMRRDLFHDRNVGALIVTSGAKQNTLDALLETVGPALLDLGYSILPCMTSRGISWLQVKKGKRSWRVVYFENAASVSVSIGLALAAHAVPALSSRASLSRVLESLCRDLYSATSAVAGFLSSQFGVALRPTAGMIALAAARRHLPDSFKKWRPVPLLMAMERQGLAYRAGIQYAGRFRGPAWRIDVNRQYTHALRQPLPLRSAFGRYHDGDSGVFVCRVRSEGDAIYPVGFWTGDGFEHSTVWRGSGVCILHTVEMESLRGIGVSVDPAWGFVYTETFSLADYVDKLQAIIRESGKDSPEGRITKALGNYVYGKLAQRPDRLEMMFTLQEPDYTWFPYVDQNLKWWPNIWERKTVAYTSSQHIDVAGVIAGAARAQTVRMWSILESFGLNVQRAHTDSLTVDYDPLPFIEGDGDSETIGEWRLEDYSEDSIIVGSNAFFDQDGAHVAGVREPTYEMVERLYAGSSVTVVQQQNTPRAGWRRDVSEVTREYQPNAPSPSRLRASR